MYSERFLSINSQRKTRQSLSKRFNFIPSPSRKPENLEISNGFLVKNKGKALSPQHQRLEPAHARLDFFDSYKKLHSAERRTSAERLSKIAYLEKVESCKLIPKPFGMMNDNARGLNMHCMGDDYALAFAEGLKHFKSLEVLNLKSNRLSAKGCYAILSSLEIHAIRFLSLCDNILGEKAVNCLFSLLQSPKQSLNHLNLENTRLTSSEITALASILSTNKTLSYLSLAKNNIHKLTSKSLKEMLHYNKSLKQLDLHWNCLKAEGACFILQETLNHPSLEDIDLSWNAIGNYENNTQVNTLADLVSRQGVLRHLNLSYNYIKGKDCEVIASELAKNHKLLVHMTGNECFIDSRGFLVPTSGRSQLKKSHLSLNMMKEENSEVFQSSNCWICEKWVEVEFVFSDPVDPPLFIHIECDGYVPEIMKKGVEGFSVLRAVPTGKLKFFFSSVGRLIRTTQYPVETLSGFLELDIKYSEKLTVPVKVKHINFIVNEAGSHLKIEEFKSILRERPFSFTVPEVDQTRVLWKFDASLFNSCELPEENYLEKCFEFDWKKSKLQNLIKVPLQQMSLHDLLKENYSFIFNTYRHLSCLSENDSPSISIQAFSQCLESWKVFDGLYRVADLEISWSGIASQNPGKSENLTRHEFLEILTRIANDRYVKNKIVSNTVDASRKLLSEIVVPNTLDLNDGQLWRKTEYFCEEIDLVFQVYFEVLQAVYYRFSRKNIEGLTFMCLAGFREFCKEAKLESEKLTSKEIYMNYFTAIPIQVDEISSKRHTEMKFVEFLEAFARCCKTAGPADQEKIIEKTGKKRLTRKNETSTLAEVIEGYIPRLVKLCPEDMRSSFVYPTAETYKKLMYRNKE